MTFPIMKSNDPIGPRLRAIRNARGWTLADVERISDGRFDGAVVRSWEVGGRRPSVEAARALLEWYGYRIEILAADEIVARARVDGAS